MIQANSYYYVKDESLARTPNLDDIDPGRIFCYTTKDSYHFGLRHQEHIVTFIEESREDFSDEEKMLYKLQSLKEN